MTTPPSGQVAADDPRRSNTSPFPATRHPSTPSTCTHSPTASQTLHLYLPTPQNKHPSHEAQRRPLRTYLPQPTHEGHQRSKQPRQGHSLPCLPRQEGQVFGRDASVLYVSVRGLAGWTHHACADMSAFRCVKHWTHAGVIDRDCSPVTSRSAKGAAKRDRRRPSTASTSSVSSGPSSPPG